MKNGKFTKEDCSIHIGGSVGESYIELSIANNLLSQLREQLDRLTRQRGVLSHLKLDLAEAKAHLSQLLLEREEALVVYGNGAAIEDLWSVELTDADTHSARLRDIKPLAKEGQHGPVHRGLTPEEAMSGYEPVTPAGTEKYDISDPAAPSLVKEEPDRSIVVTPLDEAQHVLANAANYPAAYVSMSAAVIDLIKELEHIAEGNCDRDCYEEKAYRAIRKYKGLK